MQCLHNFGDLAPLFKQEPIQISFCWIRPPTELFANSIDPGATYWIYHVIDLQVILFLLGKGFLDFWKILSL